MFGKQLEGECPSPSCEADPVLFSPAGSVLAYICSTHGWIAQKAPNWPNGPWFVAEEEIADGRGF